MRKIFLYIFIFYTGICFSQTNGGSLNATGDKSFLPNFTPPSPQSFLFTEYGKNAVNEFTGKVNLSIPIYNYKIANLTLPITLNYSGAGVKVNDLSTIVGTNWILNTGGVINRKINDKADESNYISREFINYQQMITNTTENCQPYSQYFIDLALNKDFKDTEIDEWSFNFNGYSGSFYLDGNFNPVYIENESEIKIEIIGNGSNNLEKLRNSQTFVITTPDGIRYYFGGLECEKTMVFSGHRGASRLENSSFYLYKISDNLNNEINLEYFTRQSPAILKCGKSYQLTSVGPFTEYHIPLSTSTVMLNQINNAKFLKKIKNNVNSEEVIFNLDTYSTPNYIASLKDIEVFSDSILLKKIELSYDFPNNYSSSYLPTEPASRFFLKKVEINKSLLNIDGKYEIYQFEYDNNDLMPVRFSAKQDVLGYFNNKNNHTTIPKPEYFQNSTNSSFGDLNPDFEYAKRGSLTKIVYPTKGYSLFEYESAKARKKRYKNYRRNITGLEIAEIPSYNELIDGIEYITPIYINQDVSIKINTGFRSEIDPFEGLMYYQSYKALHVELTISDITPTIPPSPLNITTISRPLGMNPVETGYTYSFKKDHTYSIRIKLRTYPNISYTFINNIIASFNVELFDGYDIIDGLGVRIKNQKDYSNDNSFSNYKRYYYKNINQINNDMFGLSEISFSPKYTITYDTNPNNFFGYFINLFSESANIYSNKESIETYDIVTISEGGDNFENGGTEKYFHKQSNEKNEKLITTMDGCFRAFDYDSGSYVVCGPPSEINTGITIVRNHAFTSEVTKLDGFNGKLILERNFINKNNSLYKNKETLYDYTFQRKHLNNAVNYVTWNLFANQIPLNFCPNNVNTPIYPLSGFFKAYYFIETFEVKLNRIVNKEYIEPVPLNQNIPYYASFEQDVDPDYATHDLNFKKITTTQTFNYASLRGLPTLTTTSTSINDKILRTQNHYANELNSLTGLTNDEQGALSNLVNENRIATPIQVEQYQNDELLATQKTIYKEHGNHLSLPERIQTSKGANPLEDRVIFEEYDAKGNPTVVLLKDGTKTKYFYNAINQVVLKVENYTSALNIPDVPDLSDVCGFINLYPSAMMSVYNYDPITHQLVSIVATNCQMTTYEYNELHQLKLIRDNDGNIIQEFDNNYKH